ncbi:MAG: DNA polymerase III subunit delta' [Gammaproteobacteria bacterium]
MNDISLIPLHPWLIAPRERLAAAIQQDRLPHALLLSGPPGVGKGAFAREIARALLCEHPTEDAAPCRQCTECARVESGAHPDLFTVQPEEDSRVIKVDQVRDLSEKLSLSSHRGGYKVAILDPAESMNINAANSLLKTLEEPSDNTVCVLVCVNPAQLPATIRSRCQQIRIGVPETAVALRWLTAAAAVAETPEMYLQLAGGAPLRAQQLAQTDIIEARQACFSALVGILDGRTEPLAVAQEWAKNEQLRGIDWMREWIMDLLRIRMSGQAEGVRSADIAEKLPALARKLDSRALFRQLDRINRIMKLSASSLNRELLTEDILLAWAEQR